MNQDELEAELHRKREAKRLLQLFQAENGREPRLLRQTSSKVFFKSSFELDHREYDSFVSANRKSRMAKCRRIAADSGHHNFGVIA